MGSCCPLCSSIQAHSTQSTQHSQHTHMQTRACSPADRTPSFVAHMRRGNCHSLCAWAVERRRGSTHRTTVPERRTAQAPAQARWPVQARSCAQARSECLLGRLALPLSLLSAGQLKLQLDVQCKHEAALKRAVSYYYCLEGLLCRSACSASGLLYRLEGLLCRSACSACSASGLVQNAVRACVVGELLIRRARHCVDTGAELMVR